MSKKQIFDIVLVFNEYDLLEQRLKLLDNHIDKFVIYDFGLGGKNYSSSKIIHIKTHKSFLDPDFDLASETVKLLDAKTLYVEDILMFSKANEIPNINELLNKLHLINTKPLICKQKKLFWVNNFVSKKDHFGTFAFTYSDLIRNKKIYKSMLNPITPITINYSLIDCGWQLNGFQTLEDFKDATNFWSNKNVSVEEFFEIFSGLKDLNQELLLHYNPNLPNSFNEFQQKPVVRESKKLTITCNKEIFNQGKELTLLIEEGKIVSNNNFEHSFTVPSNNYYDVNDFEISYSKNETIKALQKLGILNHDIITFHKKETLDEVSLTYQEFLNFVPSELF